MAKQTRSEPPREAWNEEKEIRTTAYIHNIRRRPRRQGLWLLVLAICAMCLLPIPVMLLFQHQPVVKVWLDRVRGIVPASERPGPEPRVAEPAEPIPAVRESKQGTRTQGTAREENAARRSSSRPVEAAPIATPPIARASHSG